MDLVEQFKVRCVSNKYQCWYWSIIERAERRGWKKNTSPVRVEAHHSVPKSIIKNNKVVFLTLREHLVCHILLTKFTQGTDKAKMVYSAMRMISYEKYGKGRVNSKVFQRIREEHAAEASARLTGVPKPYMTETNRNPEKIRKTAEKHRGMKRSLESRRRMSEAKKNGFVPWNKGLIDTHQKGHKKEVVECPHCRKSGGKPVMVRYHMDRCKWRGVVGQIL